MHSSDDSSRSLCPFRVDDDLLAWGGSASAAGARGAAVAYTASVAFPEISMKLLGGFGEAQASAG